MLCAAPLAAQTPQATPQPGIQQPAQPPIGQTPVPPPGQAPAPQTPGGPAPPPQNSYDIQFGSISSNGSEIHATLVKITMGEYTLSADRLDGDFNKWLVFSGDAALTYRGQTITGATIRFQPQTKEFRVEQLRTALTPDFLQGRLLSPLYVTGLDLFGTRNGPIFGDDVDATTCEREKPHYMIRAGELRVDRGKSITLKKATLYLWGHRIITLPAFVIPLDRRPRRNTYTPQFGRSVDEGWFVKSALNYVLTDRAPGIFRLDLMEKKGIGTGIEQGWNLAKAAGLIALYAIPTGGTSKNLSGRLNNRFNLGGGEQLQLDADLQQNSYLSLPQTTNFTTRMGFTRQKIGTSTAINLSRLSTDSQGFFNHSITANLAQTQQFGQAITTSFNTDFSEYVSGGGSTSTTTRQLTTRFQADDRAPNYSLQLVANKSVPIGGTGNQSFFGGVERLPEVTLNNYRFLHGPLSRLPANFELSAGRYFEGGTSISGSSNGTEADRAVLGFDLMGIRKPLSSHTDLNLSGGFQQYFYSPGYAQYVVRDNTTLTQRIGKRSGINLSYTYQRPEGGTPFRFDQQGQFHALNADMGMLDDRRFQVTARVGYDFARTSIPGFPAQPWQTLSVNTLWRPVNWARTRTLFSFDPNTGKFVSTANDLRFRGKNDFAFDLVTRYDPTRHKIGQVNGQFNIPISGGLWRVLGIFQYNGFLNTFESQSIQIVRDLHCMEAAISYVNNPFGFRKDQQVYFQLRIKAIPIFQRFGAGQFGQALDTGVGEVF